MKNKITYFSVFVFSLFSLIVPVFVSAVTLTRQLDIGMSGPDVTALQTFLATDKTIYPQGLVTGYFGILTQSAVSNFQARNGIANVGRVGPITIVALNAQMGGTLASSGVSASIYGVNVNVSANSVVINWSTNESAKGIVYYSTIPLVTYERANTVDVSGTAVMIDANFHTTQSMSIGGLQPNTTYYYLIYATDQDGNVSVTWPSTFHTNG